MPKSDGSPTRAEKSAINKADYAVAKREFQTITNDITQFVDPYRDREEIPPGLVNGNVLRRKRGARTDEDCINEVCELVASGMTCAAARSFVGVPHTLWFKWRRENVANVREKYEFAKQCNLDVMADSTIDIADSKIVPAQYDNDGHPTSLTPADQVRIREMRIKVRQWHLEHLDGQFVNKRQIDATVRSTSISETLVVNMSPQDAMREYIKMVDEKPL